MQRRLITLIFILLTKNLFCQTNLVFKNYQFDTSYQLIGVPYFYDDDKNYQNLSFLVNDTSSLNKARRSITYGQKIDSPTVENNTLNIYIVKNKKVINELDVSPKYNNIGLADSDTSTTWEYEFDISKLLKLANVTPLNYEAKLLKFKKQIEYDAFVNTHKNDKNLLCYKDESEEFEGNGTVYIQITSSTNTVDKADKLLTEELAKIVSSKKDYLISYYPTLDNKTTYKFTVNTSKIIYDKISNTLFKKMPWIFNDKEIIFYWKK